MGLTYYMNDDFENSTKYLKKMDSLDCEDREQTYFNKLYLSLVNKEQNQIYNKKIKREELDIQNTLRKQPFI